MTLSKAEIKEISQQVRKDLSANVSKVDPFISNFNHSNHIWAFFWNAIFIGILFSVTFFLDQMINNYINQLIKEKKIDIFYSHFVKFFLQLIATVTSFFIILIILWYTIGFGKCFFG